MKSSFITTLSSKKTEQLKGNKMCHIKMKKKEKTKQKTESDDLLNFRYYDYQHDSFHCYMINSVKLVGYHHITL